MKINCLGCGFKVDVDDAYDDYEGPIKCFACGAIMEMVTQEGSIRAVRSVTLRVDGQLKVIACVPWGSVGEEGE